MFKLSKPVSYILVWFISVALIRSIGYFTSFPDRIFPKIQLFVSKILIKISGFFPFSIGDVFYTVLGILLLVFFVKTIKAIYRKNWLKFRRLMSLFFIGLTVFCLIFYFFWGFNYYKTPIKENYNTEEISLDELKYLAEFYLKESKILREKTTQNEAGIFEFILNSKEKEYQILKASKGLSEIEEIKFIQYTHPNLKESLYSTIFSYMGVLGYYNPFTSEAQYNSKMPDSKRLFTEFHEVAHQWGYAPESEANFIGYLLGINSEIIEFKYVSNYKALRSLLNKIVWEDPEFVETALNRYSLKMKIDREYELEIQQKYLHRADDAFSMLNEAYLQLNNQDGLESYGQFVELLVGYHRKHGLLKTHSIRE